ncbi:MAG TPA: glycosyltransferase family 2 protein, partial [Puia sp.]|nr:glycosyltransferase family 2 protein [Puia sp.]
MTDQPLISICIPAYQRPDKLKHLLDSIQAQSYRHFEVIITDDSPGNEVCEMVRQHGLGSSIRYFRNSKPLGTPENWNESIRKAAGEWIKLMHDDDWFTTSNALERFALALRSGGASFYFSAYTNVYPDGSSRGIRSSEAYAQRLIRLPELLLASNRIGPPSVVIFKSDPDLVFDK